MNQQERRRLELQKDRARRDFLGAAGATGMFVVFVTLIIVVANN